MRKYVLFFGNRWQMTGAWAEETLRWVCAVLLYWSKFGVNEEKTMLWRGEAASDMDKPSSCLIKMSRATNHHMQPARLRASPLRWPQFPTDLRIYVYNRETPTCLWGHCGSRRRSSHIAVSCLLRSLSKAHAAFLRVARWILQSVFGRVGGDPCRTVMDLRAVYELLNSHLLPATGQVLHQMIWRSSSLAKLNQETCHSFLGSWTNCLPPKTQQCSCLTSKVMTDICLFS